MPRRGMTLTELLMTVIVIAILASMALPQYRRTVERGYWRTSQDVLRTIYAGQQVYFTINDQYVDNPTTLAQWRQIYMDDPNGSIPIPVTFSVTTNGLSGAAATFTATATRDAGIFMTIDEINILDTTAWPQP